MKCISSNFITFGESRFTLVFALVVLFPFCIKAAAPYTHTQPATSLTSSNATLNGMAVSNGEGTVAWFEWGLKGSYVHTTSPTNFGNGTAVVRVSAPISGLTNDGVYQFRLVSSNASGLVAGSIQLLTTRYKLSVWPTPVSYTTLPLGLSNAIQVSSGFRALAVKVGGSVFEWEVSGGTVYTNSASLLSNVVGVAAASSYYAAVTSDGNGYRWTATTVNPRDPAIISGASNVIAVAVGSGSGAAGVGAALSAEGTVITWANTSLPNTPSGLSNVVAVSCGNTFVLALKADGTVATWGTGPYPASTNVPSGLTNVVGIASGGWHSLALRNDGTVVAWGENASGKTNVPTGLSDVIAVSASPQNSAVLKADGTVVVWGDNSSGQTNVPFGLTNIARIDTGGSYAFIYAFGNRPPIAMAWPYFGYPNNDLTLQLQCSDQNKDLVNTRIVALPGDGTLYQYDAGNRGAPITAPDTTVTDLTNRVIFVPSTNSVGSPYTSFSFLASDGESDSSPATATVSVVLPAGPQLNPAASAWSGNGVFNLSFSGTAGAAYRVWASSNLVDWEVLGTATVTTNGWFNFLDSSAGSWPKRFYRAGAP